MVLALEFTGGTSGHRVSWGAVAKELSEQDEAPSLSRSESVHICWLGQLGDVDADVAACRCAG